MPTDHNPMPHAPDTRLPAARPVVKAPTTPRPVVREAFRRRAKPAVHTSAAHHPGVPADVERPVATNGPVSPWPTAPAKFQRRAEPADHGYTSHDPGHPAHDDIRRDLVLGWSVRSAARRMARRAVAMQGEPAGSPAVAQGLVRREESWWVAEPGDRPVVAKGPPAPGPVVGEGLRWRVMSTVHTHAARTPDVPAHDGVRLDLRLGPRLPAASRRPAVLCSFRARPVMVLSGAVPGDHLRPACDRGFPSGGRAPRALWLRARAVDRLAFCRVPLFPGGTGRGVGAVVPAGVVGHEL